MELKQAYKDFIEEAIEKHKNKLGPLKLMLHDIQHHVGYIPEYAIKQISKSLNISEAEIYGVVTFYTQFTLEPKGEYVINVCMGTACYVIGSENLLNKVLTLTNCKVNQTSDDGLFSVDATRCLGACGIAPVAVINGKVYGLANKNSEFIDQIKEICSSRRA